METEQTPIPLFLTCPHCGERHIDEGEFATKPHHTHACQECGLTWRPAIVPTVGVAFLPGFKNDKPVSTPRTDKATCKHEAVTTRTLTCADCGVPMDCDAHGNYLPRPSEATALTPYPCIGTDDACDAFVTAQGGRCGDCIAKMRGSAEAPACIAAEDYARKEFLTHAEAHDAIGEPCPKPLNFLAVAKLCVRDTLQHLAYYQHCPFCEAGNPDDFGGDKGHSDECALYGFDKTVDVNALKAWALQCGESASTAGGAISGAPATSTPGADLSAPPSASSTSAPAQVAAGEVVSVGATSVSRTDREAETQLPTPYKFDGRLEPDVAQHFVEVMALQQLVLAVEAIAESCTAPDSLKEALGWYKSACAQRKGHPVFDAWKGRDDQPLPEDEEIEAAFPTRSGRHDLYTEAMRMVGARYSKQGLVALVNMFLHRAEKTNGTRG